LNIENVKVYDLEECINFDDSKYGFIYMTINKINNKKYIGRKKYTNHYRSYLGSGSIIKEEIKRYGSKNFYKIVLENCNSEQELNEKEKYWIEYFDATNNDEFYNLTNGGIGGDTYSNLPDEQITLIKQKLNHENENNPMFNKKHDIKSKERISIKAKERLSVKENNPNYGNIGRLNPSSIKIKCIETDEEFWGIREASRMTNIPISNIIRALKSNGNFSAGKKDGVKLHWVYIKEEDSNENSNK